MTDDFQKPHRASVADLPRMIQRARKGYTFGSGEARCLYEEIQRRAEAEDRVRELCAHRIEDMKHSEHPIDPPIASSAILAALDGPQ